MASWDVFRAENCECFDARDKERLLKVIGDSKGGLTIFNAKVSELLASVSHQMGHRFNDASARRSWADITCRTATDVRRADSSANPCAPPQQLGASFPDLVDVLPGSIVSE